MTKAESIVNSRPLAVESLADPLASEPWTPNHLLTLETQVVLPPPGKFESPDLHLHKRWKRVQYLCNQFWLRWQKEYCTLLQKRQKWTQPKRSLKIGDVVLVWDEDSPRNQWPLDLGYRSDPQPWQPCPQSTDRNSKGWRKKGLQETNTKARATRRVPAFKQISTGLQVVQTV